MTQITTTFAGLKLKNPIIVSSSGLTNSAEKIKKLETAGAGAVVLKSVFEEQITVQAGQMSGYGAPEADDYLSAYVRSNALNEHIALIKEAKKECNIPVIASINCYSTSEWTEFAKHMEEAGADALEINILSLQTEKEYKYGSFEQLHIDVRAAAVVLFNRFYQPDINIDTMAFTSSNVFSEANELTEKIRWTAISSASVPKIDYAISGGVHCGKGVIKSILAGASAVEVCSAIYKYGEKEIAEMTKELTEWMASKGFENIESMKGKMNANAAGSINPFERTQFMKYYSNHE